MPVETKQFYGRCILWREMPPPAPPGEYGEEHHANDHVQGVHARHAKVKSEEQPHLTGVGTGVEKAAPGKQMLGEFVAVFNGLNAEEYGPQQYGEP